MNKRLMLILAIGGLFVLGGCGGGADSNDAPSYYVVKYEVGGFGAGDISVTYTNATGGTQQEVVRAPWSKTLAPVNPGAFVYLSAQNNSGAGSVSVFIDGGAGFQRFASSSAPYGIATSSGTCCGQ